ncbi:piggyBac transposable element-derived protein 4-like [Esox lucius]|uniref:piggyBac transposable element-derived protein 4-like n=1 Tax=Esox lucius TaxID=8010 RepID=UPI0014771513|nr:piggyBac transposable element-derived protein 4-like [Esox lucius]
MEQIFESDEDAAADSGPDDFFTDEEEDFIDGMDRMEDEIHLRSLKFGACGTIREGRKEAPKTKVNALTRKSPRGSLRWIRDGDLLFTKWMDNREVSMCSTIHPAYSGDTVQRRQKSREGHWETSHIQIPTPIIEYNKYMGGVDLSDQLIQYYSVHHITKRWYRTLFLHFLDIAITNSYILHQELCQSAQSRPLTHEAFVEQLAAELCGVTLAVAATPKLTGHTPLPTRETTDQSSRATAGRLRCELCKRNGVKKDTPWKCGECDVPLCLLADRNCFHLWHS